MRGEGLTPPLLRLISERSTVKACWISRQKSSSAAILSGVVSPADREAARMRSMPPSRSEARLAIAVALPADLKKLRRVNIVGPPPPVAGAILSQERCHR